ncbi:MAG: hypothetical protein WCD47_11215 [Candidatus Sulfotelmatobacter sp.]
MYAPPLCTITSPLWLQAIAPFLRAGESYKALIFSGHREEAEPTDRSEDKVVLVMDNKEQGKTSVFNIDSEEVEGKK